MSGIDWRKRRSSWPRSKASSIQCMMYILCTIFSTVELALALADLSLEKYGGSLGEILSMAMLAPSSVRGAYTSALNACTACSLKGLDCAVSTQQHLAADVYAPRKDVGAKCMRSTHSTPSNRAII